MKILKVKKNSELGIPMVGTKVVKGYKIVLFVGAVEVKMVDGKDVTVYHRILADDITPIVQSKLLPYFSPEPKLNKKGEATGTTPVTDLTGRLQCVSGRNWLYA